MMLDDRTPLERLADPSPLEILDQLASDVAQGVYDEPDWTEGEAVAAQLMAEKIIAALEQQL